MEKEDRFYYKIVHKDDHFLELETKTCDGISVYEYGRNGIRFKQAGLDNLKEIAKKYNGRVVEIHEKRIYL